MLGAMSSADQYKLESSVDEFLALSYSASAFGVDSPEIQEMKWVFGKVNQELDYLKAGRRVADQGAMGDNDSYKEQCND
mgnify:CR=1 FL=1|jgi:hypothetical protein